MNKLWCINGSVYSISTAIKCSCTTVVVSVQYIRKVQQISIVFTFSAPYGIPGLDNKLENTPVCLCGSDGRFMGWMWCLLGVFTSSMHVGVTVAREERKRELKFSRKFETNVECFVDAYCIISTMFYIYILFPIPVRVIILCQGLEPLARGPNQ